MSLEYSRNRKKADGTGALNKPRQVGWCQITAAEAPSLQYAKDADAQALIPEIGPCWIQASIFFRALQVILRTTHIEFCRLDEEFGMYSLSNGKLLGILAHVEALLLCSMTPPVFESSPQYAAPSPSAPPPSPCLLLF